ncbi:hypothetical protein BDQ12DRAFT_57801 [Crucibulum laeve]|uniref:HMG box domain-containing protein n=1 Tax=Crucibulum laeve TaxID=68775 RepID=A0A5C3M4G3_9AGAR|nr:hypothetical protein BDQ12DRAFT_57801 [Crucibulum laeve]
MDTSSPQCYMNQFSVDLPEDKNNGSSETESRPLPVRLAAMSLDEMKDFSTRYFNQTTEGWSAMGYIGRALNPFVLFKIMYSYFIEGSWPRAKESSAAWHKLSEEEKQPYMICARHIKKLHKEKYPNYKYSPVHGRHKSKAVSIRRVRI